MFALQKKACVALMKNWEIGKREKRETGDARRERVKSSRVCNGVESVILAIHPNLTFPHPRRRSLQLAFCFKMINQVKDCGRH